MPLFYSSPAEGLAFLEAVADDTGYAKAVYDAAVKRARDETPAADDAGTT
jgi:hypothetical protein